MTTYRSHLQRVISTFANCKFYFAFMLASPYGLIDLCVILYHIHFIFITLFQVPYGINRILQFCTFYFLTQRQITPISHGLSCKYIKHGNQILVVKSIIYLTFTTLWAFSADDRLMIFFLFFPENRIWHFMQIVSLGDNLHEMSYPVFWEK